MTILRALQPGLFTTVQDAGRVGFCDIGVPTSGVLDHVAYRLSNALVGNDADAAVLECIGVGPVLEAIDEPARVAFIGDAPSAHILHADGSRSALAAGRSATIRPGDKLSLGTLRDTFCLCLAVAGGIDVAPVLASRSTYVRGGFGGLGGRILQTGDQLPIGTHAMPRSERRLAGDWRTAPDAAIRVVLGPQDDAFTAEGIAAFTRDAYAITNSADRMGFRFDGTKIAHRASADIVSDGAVTGSIQVPGSGQPIVLLADGQSVGGYTKIATVIGADIPALVRRKPGDMVRFMAVTQDEAEHAARDQAAWLRGLIDGIEDFVDGLDTQALYDRNLVSGVVSM